MAHTEYHPQCPNYHTYASLIREILEIRSSHFHPDPPPSLNSGRRPLLGSRPWPASHWEAQTCWCSRSRPLVFIQNLHWDTDARNILIAPARIPCIVFPRTRPNVPIWHFMEVLMIMYRRYRIFQHPWPRILHIFTINWKLKPSLVKLIKSFLQFCISHEFKIHFYLNLKSLSWGQLTATDVKSRLFSSPLPCDDWPPSLRSHCISSSHQDVGCPRVSLLFLIMFYMTFWRDWFSVSISDVSPKSTYRCHLPQKWDYTTETFLFLLLCNDNVYH